MKTFRTATISAVSLSLLLATATLAQEEARDEEPVAPSRPAAEEPASQTMQPEQSRTALTSQSTIPLSNSKPTQQGARLSSSALIGTTVKNTQGEDLGKIQELMIDPQSGQISSAVLSFGGVLGMNEKKVEIPWDTLKVSLGNKELVVEVDKKQLQNVPSAETAER